MLKTRFCPSPTGLIHLGNARTALFNALLAHAKQGHFLLRIEDTDATRSSEAHAKQLADDLQWLGLNWEEGWLAGGDQGPYCQSERQAIYDRYYAELEAEGHAYPCFCSEESLALTRKVQRASGQPPRYPGTCRHLTQEEVAAKRAEGLKPTLRFKIPDEGQIEFVDHVKGRQRFQCAGLGDLIIRRADGTAAFMYCNAIDDALMSVSDALRGEDHLTNTPRQLLILQALKLTPPKYGHTSLITGRDGAPLSKRNGSRSLSDLKSEGYFPLAVVNYLARLGHYYENNALMSLAELAAEFRLENLSSSPAHFDEEQLLYWQKQALLATPAEQLWDWMAKAVKELVPEQHRQQFVALVQPNCIFPEDARFWAERIFTESWEPEEPELLGQTDAGFFETAIGIIAEVGADYSALTQQLKEKSGLKGKALFQPLRLVLTGTLKGPQLADVCVLLGAERMQQRFQRSLKQQGA